MCSIKAIRLGGTSRSCYLLNISMTKSLREFPRDFEIPEFS